MMDTQASYAIPLDLDIFNTANKAKALEGLRSTITRTNVDDGGVKRPEYSLMTGFIGPLQSVKRFLKMAPTIWPTNC